jgi:hypothetical protein
VRVFLDHRRDVMYFPEDSIRRVGEPDEEDPERYLLHDGRVIAEPEQIEIAGRTVIVWSVSCGELVTRPATDQP